jgi:hypothetical protein
MAYRLAGFAGVLDEKLLEVLIREHAERTLPRLRRLWGYFRNAEAGPGRGAGALWQASGLPARLRGSRDAGADDRLAAPEVVIENDIAWRIQAMVDFMFGKPVRILSTARDEGVRRLIERVLDAVWEASGGISLLQDTALLGHVYGHVDLLLREAGRTGDGGPRRLRAPRPGPGAVDEDAAGAAAAMLRVEVVDPTRGIPVTSASDYRRLEGYIVRYTRELNEVERWRPVAGMVAHLSGREAPGRRRRSELTEIYSGGRRQVYEDGRLVEDAVNDLTPGATPVAHIQNISQPFRYEGIGEVEPLIPLQDELNTRLSDRASRVTLQSFKMYLMKGMGPAGKLSVAPGAIWTSDDPQASVQAFGGDGESPSESAHIQEVREALDKQSGVPPLASGVVRARIGNLTSANALRITLMGVLSKTARKRVTYGGGIARMCGLILEALDRAGVLKTEARDRGVRLHWPDPLPEDLREQAEAARVKAELGVPRERVLEGLGMGAGDEGIA